MLCGGDVEMLRSKESSGQVAVSVRNEGLAEDMMRAKAIEDSIDS